MALVFEILVLALSALLWWLARRDLTAKAADARAPAAEDWARLRITVEQLMVELERRAVVAEQRIYEAEERLRVVEQRAQAALARAGDGQGAVAPSDAASLVPPAMASAALAAERAALMPDCPLADAPPAAGLAAAGYAEFAQDTAAMPADVPLTAPLLLPGAAAPPLAVDSLAPAEARQEVPPFLPSPAAPPAPFLTPEEARYQPVYALVDAGETDAAAIARQTGLPRGEIELVLSLRVRRAP